MTWEFPGGPVVRTRLFHCWGPGSIPGQGTKMPPPGKPSHMAKKKKKPKQNDLGQRTNVMD